MMSHQRDGKQQQGLALVLFMALYGSQSFPAAAAFSSTSLAVKRFPQLQSLPRIARWHPLPENSSPLKYPNPKDTPSLDNGPSTPSNLFLQKRSETEVTRKSRVALILARWNARIRRACCGWRKKALALFFCLAMAFNLASEPAWAVTGGRSGGSFKSSPGRVYSSPSRGYSPSRSYHHRPSRSYHYYRPPPTRIFYHNPRPIIVGPQMQPYGPVNRRGISPSDIILVTGAGLAIAYGVSNQLQQERRQSSSALGPGYSVAKLTVSLNVPNRDAPNSILQRLQQLSAAAPTNTRKGVQNLISNVALELLRQEKSIRSAESKSAHHRLEGEAERDFLRSSIQQRSKFDAETEYKFGRSLPSSPPKSRQDTKATEAVVTILVAIEGDSTKLPAIKSRASVLEALNRLAVDAQVEDCLLSGEISWAPELRDETLSLEDVYVDYPTLYPL
ncbi:Protein of unknown function (DUF1517) [Seminavis robusta]|uniref:Uncharacterized protein n=1 Tax=Seminavis robusta TaxID=568900 RepID=A0A9N8ENX4_9STRA|nr:Protein of unknown function (DUF1517) [Seminavis robusta]|eukprot:Sro1308_g261420.1 Protein of unknown function (DUF1517) (446) ;mRNA; f:6976-8518